MIPGTDIGAKVSILLVEDDVIDALAFERALNQHNLDNPVYRALDGMEALALLESEAVPKPFLILLDLNMPRMGGFEFLGRIRADENLKKSIVFVLTTSRDEKDINNAYEENVAGYIIKSGLVSEFSDIITMLDRYWQVVTLPGSEFVFQT